MKLEHRGRPARVPNLIPRQLLVAGALAAVAALAGCLYDPDDRCGAHRELGSAGTCVCKADLVDKAGQCVAPESDAAAPTVGLGAACSSDQPCTDSVFSECYTGGGDGYCTRHDCTADTDCGDGFYCALASKPTFCRRVPTGQNTPCASDTDCKGYDANLCLIGYPGGAVCVVRDCSGGTDCSPGYTCLDLSVYAAGLPKVCVPKSG